MHRLFRNNQSVHTDTAHPRISSYLCLLQANAAPAQAADTPPAAPIGEESEEEIEVSEKDASHGFTADI